MNGECRNDSRKWEGIQFFILSILCVVPLIVDESKYEEWEIRILAFVLFILSVVVVLPLALVTTRYSWSVFWLTVGILVAITLIGSLAYLILDTNSLRTLQETFLVHGVASMFGVLILLSLLASLKLRGYRWFSPPRLATAKKSVRAKTVAAHPLD